jgi:hypothetical protein
MRTENLLNNVDASVSQSSAPYAIDCGQDMRWLLFIKGDSLDGIPKIFIEESPNGLDWIPLNNNDCTGIFDYFPLDESVITIRDSYFMGKAFRVRFEANGNTTGTIYADLIIKTKSN